MITKKVASKKGTSSFGKLGSYLLDLDNEMDKVEMYSFENCSYPNEEYEANILEILNTQEQNQRTTQDKTFHMIFSFREGENPSKEVLKEIEKELVEALGMKEHQRMSVVHNNTDNLHVHVAINKIHPRTKNVVNTFNDTNILQRKTIELEEKFNLQIDNHSVTKTEEAKKAYDDKTIHTGFLSFNDWVKQYAKEDIKNVLKDENSNWLTLFEKLAEYDLELREHGNGYVISSKTEPLFLKASSVDRDLSKGKLFDKYGMVDFKEMKEATADIKPRMKYEKMKAGIERKRVKSSYWEIYKQEQEQKKENRRNLFAKEKEYRLKRVNEIRKKWNLARENVRSTRLGKSKIKVHYSQIALNRKIEMNEFLSNQKKEREKIYEENKPMSYKDFLIEKCLKGDVKALDELKKTMIVIKRRAAKRVQEDIIKGNETLKKADDFILDYLEKSVNKRGDVTYIMGENSKIIDKGDEIKSENAIDDRQILATLHLGIEKFGKNLKIDGTNEFKQNIARVAIENNLDVFFSNKELKGISDAAEDTKTEFDVRTLIGTEAQITLLATDSNPEYDKDKKHTINKNLASLYKKTNTNAPIFMGDLRKIGIEYDVSDAMDKVQIDIKVNGFKRDERNENGLKAMNKAIIDDLREKGNGKDIERFEKFLYVYERTNKVADVTFSFYRNRGLDVDKFIKQYDMKLDKLEKKADGVNLSSKRNLNILRENTSGKILSLGESEQVGSILKETEKTEVFIAIKNNRYKTIEDYIKYGGDINIENEKGNTIGHEAALKGSLKILQKYIDEKGDLNKKNKNGETVLDVASKANLLEISINDKKGAIEVIKKKKVAKLPTKELLKGRIENTIANKKGIAIK